MFSLWNHLTHVWTLLDDRIVLFSFLVGPELLSLLTHTVRDFKSRPLLFSLDVFFWTVFAKLYSVEKKRRGKTAPCWKRRTHSLSFLHQRPEQEELCTLSFPLLRLDWTLCWCCHVTPRRSETSRAAMKLLPKVSSQRGPVLCFFSSPWDQKNNAEWVCGFHCERPGLCPHIGVLPSSLIHHRARWAVWAALLIAVRMKSSGPKWALSLLIICCYYFLVVLIYIFFLSLPPHLCSIHAVFLAQIKL